MIKSSGFVRDVIAKHFYTILTCIKFQWISKLSISKLTINTKARGNVFIDFFIVWELSGLGVDSSIGSRFASSLRTCTWEWNIESILAIVKLNE